METRQRARLCLLRQCIRQGFVIFRDLRVVVSDIFELWLSIRLYVWNIGIWHVKDEVYCVSLGSVSFFRLDRFSFSSMRLLLVVGNDGQVRFSGQFHCVMAPSETAKSVDIGILEM